MVDRRLRGALVPMALALVLLTAAQATAAVTTAGTPRPRIFVLGDAAPDSIRVECVQDQLKVNGSDPSQGTVSCTDLIELHVSGGGGNDFVDLSHLDFGLIALHEENPAPQITADGADGDDTVLVGAGVGIGSGGRGDDTLRGSDGLSLLEGGPGDDRLIARANLDFLKGGAGDDLLSGGKGPDFVFGDPGDDRILGAKGDDELFAGDGRDVVVGATGNDTLAGQGGRDLLRGGAGDDRLLGGKGTDRLIGGPGDDKEIQEGSFFEALFGGLEGVGEINASRAGPS